MICHEKYQDLQSDRVLARTEKAAISTTVPKLLQRRLSPLARAVFNVAEACLGGNKTMPVVFSTSHGEVSKSLEMLRGIQLGEEVSPTTFSLSVHNAIAGLFSMGYANHQEITVIAPGQDGIAPAFIEAFGLLQEPHDNCKGAGEIADEVLIVLYDEPLPDFYPSQPFLLSSSTICALALKVSLAGEGLLLRFKRSLAHRHRDDGEHAVQLLSFWKFLISDRLSLALGNHRQSWEWHKK
jgi:hypothetical protein